VSILTKARSLVAELGASGASAYLIHRALGCVGGGFYWYHFVAQPVLKAPLLVNGRGRSIDVREVDLGRTSTFSDLPLTPEVISYRKHQKAVCLCAFKNDQVVGCLWLCLGPYREDEVRCLMFPEPRGRTSWDFDVYVRPEHRLGLVFVRLWEATNLYLSAHGVQWSISRISVANRRSLAAHARLGTRRIGSALFVRIGKAQLMISSLRPFLHLSFSPASIPVLVLVAPK
jgi:hypothetical protein